MLAGPYATMMLADLGAEVTKIEPPGGDISRQVSDAYFASLNRGKRSICLDLTSEAGQARAWASSSPNRTRCWST
jgi:CoA:oxalate CoA-transferase